MRLSSQGGHHAPLSHRHRRRRPHRLDRGLPPAPRRARRPPSCPASTRCSAPSQLNFSINELPARAGQLRHLGFEDEAANGFSSTHDVNGIEWELFSPADQDAKIPEVYGDNVVWAEQAAE